MNDRTMLPSFRRVHMTQYSEMQKLRRCRCSDGVSLKLISYSCKAFHGNEDDDIERELTSFDFDLDCIDLKMMNGSTDQSARAVRHGQQI